VALPGIPAAICAFSTAVDTHADEKDHEIAIDLRRHSLRDDIRQYWSP
jgi:hypothetical protein